MCDRNLPYCFSVNGKECMPLRRSSPQKKSHQKQLMLPDNKLMNEEIRRYSIAYLKLFHSFVASIDTSKRLLFRLKFLITVEKKNSKFIKKTMFQLLEIFFTEFLGIFKYR